MTLRQSEMPISLEDKFKQMFRVGDIIRIAANYVVEIVEIQADKVLVETETGTRSVYSLDAVIKKLEHNAEMTAKTGLEIGDIIKFPHGGVAQVVEGTENNKPLIKFISSKKGRVIELDVSSPKDIKEQRIEIASRESQHTQKESEMPEIEERIKKAEQEGRLFKNIVFEAIKTKKGKMSHNFTNRYQASGIDGKRKAIVLDDNDATIPIVNTPYIVEQISDTNPDNSSAGKFIVRILKKDIIADLPLNKEEKYERADTLPSAIEIYPDSGIIMVGRVMLEMAKHKGPLTPKLEDFEQYTIDEQTLKMLETIAEAVVLKQPCLITGITATSKTSAIRYLAALTGHEVIRMNCAGQTDASEFIGKYVPNDGKLAMEFEELLRDKVNLSEPSLEILRAVEEEMKRTKVYRGLTKIEAQKIAAYENFQVHAWRWQDGVVPTAMKTGAWLILDELNLAENRVRERLNPVLEIPPSLVISEHESETIRQMSDEEALASNERIIPMNEETRFFGTQNFSGDAGRMEMEAQEKRRWPIRITSKVPNARQFELHIKHIVYGEEPDILENPEIQNSKTLYKGRKQDISLYSKLLEIPKMREFIFVMSKFHEALLQKAEKREIGKNEKEIFTRQCLVHFFEFLEHAVLYDRLYRPPKPMTIKTHYEIILKQAFEIYYLAKMQTDDDRKKVLDLLELLGLMSKDESRILFDLGIK